MKFLEVEVLNFLESATPFLGERPKQMVGFLKSLKELLENEAAQKTAESFYFFWGKEKKEEGNSVGWDKQGEFKPGNNQLEFKPGNNQLPYSPFTLYLILLLLILSRYGTLDVGKKGEGQQEIEVKPEVEVKEVFEFREEKEERKTEAQVGAKGKASEASLLTLLGLLSEKGA